MEIRVFTQVFILPLPFSGCFKQNKRSGVGYFYNPREKKFYQQLYEDDLV